MSQWIHLGGVKAFADGSLGSKSALFYEVRKLGIRSPPLITRENKHYLLEPFSNGQMSHIYGELGHFHFSQLFHGKKFLWPCQQ